MSRHRKHNTLWQDDRGQWHKRVHVFLAQDPLTGKQTLKKKTFTGASPEDVELRAAVWVAEEKKAFRDGAQRSLTDPGKDTLAVFGRRWLTERQLQVTEEALKQSTWASYDAAFHAFIEAPPKGMPNIGKVAVKALTVEHVRALYTHLRKTPNGRGIVNAGRARTIHKVLRQVFTKAYRETANPHDLRAMLLGVFGRQPSRKKSPTLTGEQLATFLQAADADPYRAFWYLFAMTGARPGELLALSQRSVDLPAHTITISQTLRRMPRVPEAQRWAFTEPKTDNARRVVEFPPELVPILEEHRKRQRKALATAKLKAGTDWDGRYVHLEFTTPNGRPVDWADLTKQYRRICRRAGLGTFGPAPERTPGKPGPAKQPQFTPLLSPYHLRHTHITLLLEDGVPIEVISGRAGHYKASFTHDTYVGKQTGRQQLATAVWSTWLQKQQRTGTER